MNDLTTSFVRRLRARDPQAWFELWETFGPVLRAQLHRWGRGRIGQETVQDLSQETLAALATAIDRHDPSKGARFSTWLLAIARYTLGDEMDRRNAQKRGGGVKPHSLEEEYQGESPEAGPGQTYEREVFEAKVAAALRQVERECDFLEFSVYRMRVLDGLTGRQVAEDLGISPPTVSRRLAAVRQKMREKLFEVFSKYSFTEEEMGELARNGLAANPSKEDEAGFDEAVAEIYHRICAREHRAARAES
ncbi:MAG: sigma-70 family RNA polymerase sigma factor [Planctomycetes bacterium]|nr:sigma-70 family RNA polymerase sigma factor [Planctomycetota bacterium]